MSYKLFLLVSLIALPAYAQNADKIEVQANACEKVIEGESKSSTRVRAADKAVFLGIKKLDALTKAQQILNEHDLNVMIYRLVDEYIEDLSVNTAKTEENKVCVDIHGYLDISAIEHVQADFISGSLPANEVDAEIVAEVAKEVEKDVTIKPENPENLALLNIQPVEYYNGAKSEKFTGLLKKHFDDNPYFYLTDDQEIADYTITPKVLKAKVDNLDTEHKRLQMVVVLEIKGLKDSEIVSEQQNRFVLFTAAEDEQQTASRLLNKLLENAADGALRKIESHAQKKLEEKTLGRTLRE